MGRLTPLLTTKIYSAVTVSDTWIQHIVMIFVEMYAKRRKRKEAKSNTSGGR